MQSEALALARVVWVDGVHKRLLEAASRGRFLGAMSEILVDCESRYFGRISVSNSPIERGSCGMVSPDLSQ